VLLLALLGPELDGEGVVIWTGEVVCQPALGLADVFLGNEAAVWRD